MTPIISEHLIEAAIVQLGDLSTAEMEKYTAQFADEQSSSLAYLVEGAQRLLTTSEKEYEIYLALILWTTLNKNLPKGAPPPSQEYLGTVDEQNWALYNRAKGKSFHDKVTPFFEDYPQEDLLAFVEDSIAEEEDQKEDYITDVGRPILFIQLKTLIDSWCGITQ